MYMCIEFVRFAKKRRTIFCSSSLRDSLSRSPLTLCVLSDGPRVVPSKRIRGAQQYLRTLHWEQYTSLLSTSIHRQFRWVNYYFGVNANVVILRRKAPRGVISRARFLHDAKIRGAREVVAHARVVDNLWFACSKAKRSYVLRLPQVSSSKMVLRANAFLSCGARYLPPFVRLGRAKKK